VAKGDDPKRDVPVDLLLPSLMTTVDLKISSSSFKALYLSSMGLMGVAAAALEEGVPTAATLLGVAFCPAGVKGVPCPPVMEGGGGFALGVLSKLAFACTGVVVKALDDDHGSDTESNWAVSKLAKDSLFEALDTGAGGADTGGTAATGGAETCGGVGFGTLGAAGCGMCGKLELEENGSTTGGGKTIPVMAAL